MNAKVACIKIHLKYQREKQSYSLSIILGFKDNIFKF